MVPPLALTAEIHSPDRQRHPLESECLVPFVIMVLSLISAMWIQIVRVWTLLKPNLMHGLPTLKLGTRVFRFRHRIILPTKPLSGRHPFRPTNAGMLLSLDTATHASTAENLEIAQS